MRISYRSAVLLRLSFNLPSFTTGGNGNISQYIASEPPRFPGVSGAEGPSLLWQLLQN
jgi:hypothetical protein